MKHREATLLLSGAASALSLIVSAVSLTIAVIAAARPPVSQWFTAAENIERFGYVSWLWVVPCLNLVPAGWAMLQVVLRRPMWNGRAGTAVVAQVPAKIIAPAVMLVLGAMSVSLSLRAIPAAGSTPLTDSSAFSGISISLGLMALPFAMLSFALFNAWWRVGPAINGPIESRDELGRA